MTTTNLAITSVDRGNVKTSRAVSANCQGSRQRDGLTIVNIRDSLLEGKTTCNDVRGTTLGLEKETTFGTRWGRNRRTGKVISVDGSSKEEAPLVYRSGPANNSLLRYFPGQQTPPIDRVQTLDRDPQGLNRAFSSETDGVVVKEYLFDGRRVESVCPSHSPLCRAISGHIRRKHVVSHSCEIWLPYRFKVRRLIIVDPE